MLKKSGQSTSVISEALGHDSEHTTQIYLDSFTNDVLDEASKALLQLLTSVLAVSIRLIFLIEGIKQRNHKIAASLLM